MSEPLVLLVDDYQDSREMYAEYLELVGFRVVQAADGEEALRVAGETLPDVVLMDIGLPGLDGREATRRLKAGATTSHIPVVIMSGMPPDFAKSTGADSYVTKPCPPDTLVTEINRVLGRP